MCYRSVLAQETWRVLLGYEKSGYVMNNRMKCVCIFVFTALIALSCGKDSPTGSSGTGTYGISGYIAGQDDNGVDGVHIQLSGEGVSVSAVSDSTGAYVFTGIPNGFFMLEPAKEGYKFNPSMLWVDLDSPYETVGNTTAIPVSPPDITFVSIPGGTFQMGDVEGEGEERELPVHTVTLSLFEMSVYEITNAQYAKYLNDAAATEDILPDDWVIVGTSGGGCGWFYIGLASNAASDPENQTKITYVDGSFIVEPGYENRPVGKVTWYGAKAFAEYYGFDLPTEAEWEYACRGGNQYGYGTADGEITISAANYAENEILHSVNVGSYPANQFGLYDMSGNVEEWCNDWYGAYTVGEVTDPAGPLTSHQRVIHGGSWYDGADTCRSSHRKKMPPMLSPPQAGFRVVRR